MVRNPGLFRANFSVTCWCPGETVGGLRATEASAVPKKMYTGIKLRIASQRPRWTRLQKRRLHCCCPRMEISSRRVHPLKCRLHGSCLAARACKGWQWQGVPTPQVARRWWRKVGMHWLCLDCINCFGMCACCLYFAVGVGSSCACTFHVLILMCVLVLNCEVLWASLVELGAI